MPRGGDQNYFPASSDTNITEDASASTNTKPLRHPVDNPKNITTPITVGANDLPQVDTDIPKNASTSTTPKCDTNIPNNASTSTNTISDTQPVDQQQSKTTTGREEEDALPQSYRNITESPSASTNTKPVSPLADQTQNQTLPRGGEEKCVPASSDTSIMEDASTSANTKPLSQPVNNQQNMTTPKNKKKSVSIKVDTNINEIASTSNNTKPLSQLVDPKQNQTSPRIEKTLPPLSDANIKQSSTTDQFQFQVPIVPQAFTQAYVDQGWKERGSATGSKEPRKKGQNPLCSNEKESSEQLQKTAGSNQRNQDSATESVMGAFVLELVDEEDVLRMTNVVTTGRDNEVLVSLSPSQSNRGEYITRHDLKKLLSNDITGDGWLNSQTIWMISCLMMERNFSHTDLPRVKIIDSCYFKPNKKKGTKRDNLERACGDIDTLEGWDLILMPLSNNSHWYLYALDVRKKTIQAYDSLYSTDTHHDDLQHAKNFILKKVGEESESWRIDMDDVSPKQSNTYDCGVFMMCTMQFLCLDEQLQYTQNKIELFRKYFLCSIFMEHLLGNLLIQSIYCLKIVIGCFTDFYFNQGHQYKTQTIIRIQNNEKLIFMQR